MKNGKNESFPFKFDGALSTHRHNDIHHREREPVSYSFSVETLARWTELSTNAQLFLVSKCTKYDCTNFTFQTVRKDSEKLFGNFSSLDWVIRTQRLASCLFTRSIQLVGVECSEKQEEILRNYMKMSRKFVWKWDHGPASKRSGNSTL